MTLRQQPLARNGGHQVAVESLHQLAQLSPCGPGAAARNNHWPLCPGQQADGALYDRGRWLRTAADVSKALRSQRCWLAEQVERHLQIGWPLPPELKRRKRLAQ